VAEGNSWDSCAATDQTCHNFVALSGTVEVIATVDGVQVTASVQVTVIPCPTGDKILDSKKVRDGLKTLMDSSRATGPVPFRVEQVALIYRNPTTGEISIMVYPNTLQNTGCQSSLPASIPANRPPDSWIIAEVHSHPFSAFTEDLMVPCGFPPGNRYEYDDQKWGGLSKSDRDLVEKPRAPQKDPSLPWRQIPEYVIDNDNIFRGDPGDLLKPVLPVHKWPRFTAKCSIP
jgi:hypothetical protein